MLLCRRTAKYGKHLDGSCAARAFQAHYIPANFRELRRMRAAHLGDEDRLRRDRVLDGVPERADDQDGVLQSIQSTWLLCTGEPA